MARSDRKHGAGWVSSEQARRLMAVGAFALAYWGATQVGLLYVTPSLGMAETHAAMLPVSRAQALDLLNNDIGKPVGSGREVYYVKTPHFTRHVE